MSISDFCSCILATTLLRQSIDVGRDYQWTSSTLIEPEQDAFTVRRTIFDLLSAQYWYPIRLYNCCSQLLLVREPMGSIHVRDLKPWFERRIQQSSTTNVQCMQVHIHVSGVKTQEPGVTDLHQH